MSAGLVHHVLNDSVAGLRSFRKEADSTAFERIMAEAAYPFLPRCQRDFRKLKHEAEHSSSHFTSDRTVVLLLGRICRTLLVLWHEGHPAALEQMLAFIKKLSILQSFSVRIPK
jgi:hypothetical protein